MNFLNIYKVNNFQNHKNKLINLINKIPKTIIELPGEKISHTDWQIPKTMEREYIQYFLDNIFKDFAKQLCFKFNLQSISLKNMWFQVYKKGDFHETHRHPDAHFANVFFINLPSINLKTKIYSLNNDIIEMNIEEGDILTFPAFLKHESIENTFSEEKIVISFNIDIF
tara:strand:- start:96 stop:602 length:507 start_codon:yes stop_codon:yes gene_type:complete